MFKHILSASLVSLFLMTSAFASSARPIESLHDLPSHWEGVAGGLFTKVPAVFNIDKVLKVTRNDNGNAFSATYEVSATLSFGDRKLPVTSVVLNRYEGRDSTYETYLVTNDELISTVYAAIVYDEASDTYRLSEMPRGGERRFVLTAAAPKR